LGNYQIDFPQQQSVVDLVQQYLIALPDLAKKGKSVLFFGPPGTGKDHLLVAMMKAAVMGGVDLHWDDGAEMFGKFRDNMRGSESETTMLDRYTRPTILAISDPSPPFGGLTSYQASMFFRIVDRRYRDMKPTWITINVADRAEAEERIGASIVDRLGHDALALPCNWPSFRINKHGAV